MGVCTQGRKGGADEMVVSRELQVPGMHPSVTSLVPTLLCAHGMLAANCDSPTVLTDLQSCPAAPCRHPSSSEKLTPWKSGTEQLDALSKPSPALD